MRHATANRPSGARRPLAAAIAVAVITAAPVAESPQFIRTAQRCHEISLFYLAHTPISTIYIFPIYLFSSYFYLFFN